MILQSYQINSIVKFTSFSVRFFFFFELTKYNQENFDEGD